MNCFKYIAISWFFVMGILFVGKTDKTTFHVKTEKTSTESYQQTDRINVDAFLQKSTSQKQSVDHSKFSPDGKWSHYFSKALPHFAKNIGKSQHRFGTNFYRHQRIFLLLFPHHHFW